VGRDDKSRPRWEREERLGGKIIEIYYSIYIESFPFFYI
jgi:hypothetical protein